MRSISGWALVFLAVLFLAYPRAGSGYSQVRFGRLSLEHGLAQSSIQDMAGDARGFMWFGTQYGLSRYDGYGFVNLHHMPDEPASLSHSRIKRIVPAPGGGLWVGTASGVNWIDTSTLDVRRIPVIGKRADERKAEQPQVHDMAVGQGGHLVVLASGGLLIGRDDNRRLVPVPGSANQAEGSSGALVRDDSGTVWLRDGRGLWRLTNDDEPRLELVMEDALDAGVARQDSIAVTASGDLALASREGVLLVDPASGRLRDRIRPVNHGLSENWVGAVAADPRGDIWLLTRARLVQFEPETRHWVNRLERGGARRSDQLIHALDLALDQQGFLWVGLSEGVGLSDPDGDQFRLFRHDPDRDDSLSPSPQSSSYEVHVDRYGVVWAGGGLGGLSRFSPQSTRFEHVSDHARHDVLGNDNVVRAVLEQGEGREPRLWTGLSAGGIRVWEREAGRYQRVLARFHSLAPVSRRLPDDSVWALRTNPASGNIWASTSGGLVVISPDSMEVLAVHSVVDEKRSHRFPDMLFSADGRELRVGHSSRLLRFAIDGPQGRPDLIESLSAAPNGAPDNKHGVVNFLQLRDGRILVGTHRGIVHWDPQEGDLSHSYPAGVSGRHPRNYIFGLAESADGSIWLGSAQGGLARGSFRDGEFGEWQWYDRSDGLPDQTVYAVLPDDDGRLWLSGNRGLARFDPGDHSVQHFTPADGLQSLEFNSTVATIGASGLYYFGGIDGVSVFRPDKVQPHPDPPIVHLQRASIEGQELSVKVGTVPTIDVPHDHDTLEAEVVGLHFAQPSKNRYQYRLRGVDESWIDGHGSRRVRYPELTPGSYRLEVRAANGDSIWSEPRNLLSLTIEAPPWVQPWAWALYAAVSFALTLAYVLAQRRRRLRLEQEVSARTLQLRDQKRMIDRQAEELRNMLNTRTTLFANISHEFRTPLSLVEAGVDRLVRDPGDGGAALSIRRYLRRMLRLVNQLLDLSRVQAPDVTPADAPWSLDEMVALTIEAFRSLSEHRGIMLESAIEGRFLTRCRRSDIECILLNLLGNAVKYCRSGDRVRVALLRNGDGVELSVADTGPGIDADQRERIFERFTRLPAHERGRVEGSGVGLTLVREAAVANGGCVGIDHDYEGGTCFQVWLPVCSDSEKAVSPIALTDSRLELELSHASGTAEHRAVADHQASPTELPKVLIAEDNADMREHLVSVLRPEWDASTAADGRSALELARRDPPDVIVSDIMMPELDGLGLLESLRDDIRTSHIPVLLLTARQDDEVRVRAFSLSADDFLLKPFNPAELRLRLWRMDDMRRRIQARLQRQSALGPAGVAEHESTEAGFGDISDRDRRLLRMVRAWFDDHFDDPQARIADLADHVAMNERTLQRKLKALTGETPAAQLQTYRLSSARQLLRESGRSVQDIALSCGFSSAQYFSRAFASLEGVSPSKWRRAASE